MRYSLISHRSLLPLILLLFLSQSACAEWFSREHSIMGTNIRIAFSHDSKPQAEQLLKACADQFRAVDQQMSPYKSDSELSHINRDAYTGPVTVSTNLFKLLEQALQLSYLSHGAFDITYASVGYLYDYRKKQQPTKEAITSHLAGINFHAVNLNKAHKTIRFSHPDTRIDLGGIAKGYAVDQVIALLKQHGVTQAMITAGGDTRIIGKRGNKPWVVGIKDPRDTQKSALLLPLEEGSAISTSGDYERYFIDENQQRHHHILNPKTGKSPEGGIQSVTILGPDATTTDGLSTTVFVLGLKEGLKLINRLPGIEAIIISQGKQFHFSDGLQQLQ